MPKQNKGAVMQATIDRLREQLRERDGVLAAERQRAERLSQDVSNGSRQVAEKVAVIAARDEIIRQKDGQISAVAAERDRIMRLVDQFTSLEIHAIAAPGNTPRDLRRA